MQIEKTREKLYQLAKDGVLFSLNLPDTTLTRALVKNFFGKMIHTVIDFAVDFDQRILNDGVQLAARWVAEKCGTPVVSYGTENIPTTGPVLVAANHPGLTDSIALISTVPRQDIKALVAVQYFHQLPHAKPHLIYTDRSMGSSVRAVREAIKHLQSGGLLLLFPTGHNDPDPDVQPTANLGFNKWSSSVSLFLRKVPETKLLLSVISGIVAPQYLKHPIARIQPNRRFQQRVAELFQMYAQFIRKPETPLGKPRVSFAEPIRWDQLANSASQSVDLQIQTLAQQLLASHMNQAA
ncbi:MAG: 1-acyl-sn-glycerol-3-phosphate acyltransferase [Chloroflexota bacterium]